MASCDQEKLFSFKLSGKIAANCDNGFQADGHQEILIRPGLWMSMINFSSDTPVCLEYEKQYPVIDFGFVISGNIRNQVIHADIGPGGLRLKDGISGMKLSARRTGAILIPADAKQQILHLHMTLPFFRSVVKQGIPVLPPEMQKILKGESPVEFQDIRPMNPDIQAVVYQLLNRSGTALPWPLYLEGKSLELLCLHLGAIVLEHGHSSRRKLLNPDEKQKILEARDLLTADLQSPPSLENLSRYTGLTPAKLQAGFRQAYGKSVFDYFREYRMLRARKLFDDTRTNVSQTAWEVGYTNVSHFSDAFKKRFGILPKQYLKNRLQPIKLNYG